VSSGSVSSCARSNTTFTAALCAGTILDQAVDHPPSLRELDLDDRGTAGEQHAGMLGTLVADLNHPHSDRYARARIAYYLARLRPRALVRYHAPSSQRVCNRLEADMARVVNLTACTFWERDDTVVLLRERFAPENTL
jgi:hypothetical protein